MATTYHPDYDHPSQDDDIENKLSAISLNDPLDTQSATPSMEYPRDALISKNTSDKKERNNTSLVEQIIQLTPICYLKPKCFFVAWNSVITLVFNGWPEPICTMKRELSQHGTLCREMFGSKFPKITLASVKDGIEITPSRLAKIRQLCLQNPVPNDWVLSLDLLSVVLYENRCQESVIYEKIIPLKKNHKFLGAPRPLLQLLTKCQSNLPLSLVSDWIEYCASIGSCSKIHNRFPS
eukprot:254980_1